MISDKNNNKMKIIKSTFISSSFLFILITILTIIAILDIDFFRIFSQGKFKGIQNLFTTYSLERSEKVNQTIIYALFETLQIALIGTYFGVIFSFPFSILAASNLNSKLVYIPIRIVLSSIRTIPSLIWGLLAVIAFGLGPRAGVIAIIFYTIGYISKFQYETFEGIKTDPIEALSAIGATKLQITRYVVFPETANELISQIIFMFEYNIRSSSIIGFVGAGGIGFLLALYLDYFRIGALSTALIYLLIIVVIIDFIGSSIRKRFQDPNFEEINF
jgi:phosphonate transport system permease protein